RTPRRARKFITVEGEDQCSELIPIRDANPIRSIVVGIGLAAGLRRRCRFTSAPQNCALLNRLNNLGINRKPARTKLTYRRRPRLQPLVQIIDLEIDPAALYIDPNDLAFSHHSQRPAACRLWHNLADRDASVEPRQFAIGD